MPQHQSIRTLLLRVTARRRPVRRSWLIAARVSAEAPHDGVIGSLVTFIQNDVTASVSQEAVVYPALLTNYPSGVAQGKCD